MAAPTITREWEIDYGSTLVIGGASGEYLLMKPGFGIFESYRQARVTCLVFVNGNGSTSAFLTAVQTFQTQMRIPRQRLQVKTPSGMLDLNPTAGVSTNTGFDAEPEFEKSEQFPRLNTGTSRVYRCSWTVSLPADLSGQSGRRDNFVNTEYEPNRRRVIELRGTYTALAANDATAAYLAAIGTYTGLSATLPTDGGLWQLVSETRSRNDTDKMVEFNRKYREITLAQDNSGAGADNSSVVDQTLTVSREYIGQEASYIPGFTYQVNAFRSYLVNYRGVIDKTVTSSLVLEDLWNNTLRAHVVAQARDRIGADISVASVESEKLDLDLDNTIIVASFRMIANAPAATIQATASARYEGSTGKLLTPATTGDPHVYAIDEGPPMQRVIYRVMETVLENGRFSNPGVPDGYVELTRNFEDSEVIIGTQPTGQIRLKRRNYEIMGQRAIPYGGSALPTPGNSGGSSGSSSTGGQSTKHPPSGGLASPVTFDAFNIKNFANAGTGA